MPYADGAHCDTGKAGLDSLRCAPGLACVSIDAAGQKARYCRPICDTNAASPCKSGTCFPLATSYSQFGKSPKNVGVCLAEAPFK